VPDPGSIIDGECLTGVGMVDVDGARHGSDWTPDGVIVRLWAEELTENGLSLAGCLPPLLSSLDARQ
jgi:hypothetical protein